MQTIKYKFDTKSELSLSYIPFVKNGGIFIKGHQTLGMGQIVILELNMPEGLPDINVEAKVVWLTPIHAMHHALSGAGLQLIGDNAASVKAMLEENMEPGKNVGAYAYGMLENLE